MFFLELPENLPFRVRELTLEITAGLQGHYKKMKVLERYLRDNYTYNTEKLYLGDRDFVDFFLFDTGEGYCTYFATALAVMGRVAGVPTRYVVGFKVPERRSEGGIYEVAGTNAHQNVGLIVVSGTGRRLLSVFVDPYVRSFRFVTNHLQLPRDREPSEDLVLEALARGASYIAFERIADPTGFSFHAEAAGEVVPMGSEVSTGSRLVFQSPMPARFRLIRSGISELELEGVRFSFDTEAPGTYRVEVYPLNPPRLLKGKPWILSNPIYVR